MQIPEKLISLAEQGDLAALAELDAKGIFCADNENAASFAARVRLLNQKNQELDEALAADGSAAIEDVTIHQQDRIPENLFLEPLELTEKLYRFQADWVAGFFVDPAYGLLFGGCAYYFYPDFFALFIIRRSFRDKARWLFYQRKELLAHELCHVARVSFRAHVYEEIFAYKTATTAFRRFFGGIFRSPKDSFLFIGASCLLLVNQLCRAFLFPQLPSWPMWCLLVGILCWLVLRLLRDMKILRKARKHLAFIFPEQNVIPVLFRCNDAEIQQLAILDNPQDAQTWLENRKSTSLRWKITCTRFE
ncbi:MAG: hypothetical protein GX927_12185 [Lentisphaerae bacterium]|nr:hypothetical protein [Lentisphaerota bacterium]